MPQKPKSSTAAVPLAKYVGSTVILDADADLSPARNQVIYSTVPDNNQSLLSMDTLDTKTHTENAIEEEYCTNINIIDFISINKLFCFTRHNLDVQAM